jgi:NADH:ubiquinone oxidoreductase subunit 2 (subunit N)
MLHSAKNGLWRVMAEREIGASILGIGLLTSISVFHLQFRDSASQNNYIRAFTVLSTITRASAVYTILSGDMISAYTSIFLYGISMSALVAAKATSGQRGLVENHPLC